MHKVMDLLAGKKHLVVIATCGALIVGGVSACGGAKTSTTGSAGGSAAVAEVHYADEDFTAAVAKALEARWKITDKFDSNPFELGATDMDEALKAELAPVAEYKDAKFKNQDLAEAASAYVEALEGSHGKDFADQNDSWSSAYSHRVSALHKINEISEIKVPDKYKENLSDVLNDGEAAAVAQDLQNVTVFEKQDPKDEYDTYPTYAAVVENKSELNFSYFEFDINLVDKDGVVVETQTASTENWAGGTKHRFEFMSDANFDHIEICGASWNL